MLFEILKWLIENSIEASILVGVIFVLRYIFKSKINTKYIYWLWIILIIKLLSPYAPESKVSIYNLIGQTISTVSNEDNTMKNQYNISNSEENQVKSNEDSNAHIAIKNTEDNSNLTINSQIKNSRKENRALMIESVVITLWAIGICVYIVKAILSKLRLVQIMKTNKNHNNDELNNLLTECMRIMEINKQISILPVNEIRSPAIVGIVNPKIMIPSVILETISREQLKYIIIHELCHFKQKDIILTWVIYLVKAVYWFNPIIIIALNTLQWDCEIISDENVMFIIGEGQKFEYGNTLIKVLENINYTSSYLGASNFLGSKSRVRGRIKMICKKKIDNVKSVVIGMILILFVSIIGLTSVVLAEVEPDKNLDVISSKNLNHEVILYSTHVQEEYKSGNNVEQVASMINKKLQLINIDSKFIENDKYVDYASAYAKSGELIKENVKDYENKILLDIHSGDSEKSINKGDVRKISVVLAKNNLNFVENEGLANSLVSTLKEIGVAAEVQVLENGIVGKNQELSNRTISINIGAIQSTEEDIQYCVDALTESISSLIN